MLNPEVAPMACIFIEGVGCYELARDFASPMITLIVAYFGVTFAFRQIDVQHKNTIRAQIEEQKRSTKIELFKDLNVLMDNASETIRSVNTFCMVRKYSSPDSAACISHEEYFAILDKLGNALLAMISKVESHEVIHFKLFRVFRFALQSIHYELLTLRNAKDRSHLLDRILKLSDDAQCYLGDFQVCLQNMAYAEAFGSPVPHRVAIDKSNKVIVDEPYRLDKLMSYFTKETAWGKNCDRYQKEAIAEYHS